MGARDGDRSYLSQDGASPAERVPFVSRSAPGPAQPEPSGLGADGAPLPGLRDRALWAVLVLALTLQALSWWNLEGYQLADSVEYMERAESFARGHAQDGEGAVRGFGFSLLLAPFFYLQEILGLGDGRATVYAVRAFQMFLGLCLIAVCARLGSRLGGRRAGLAAGFLVAVNPIFLQYTVSPVAGVAAALFVALGLDALVQCGSTRRAFVGGLWLGAAFLMAFKTMLVSVPLLLLVLSRDRWKDRQRPLAAAAGLLVAVVVQVGIDRITWGSWGHSLGNYVVENASGVLVRLLHSFGFTDLARTIYERSAELQEFQVESASSGPRQLQSRAFYLTEIQRMLVWPVVALGVLGLLRAWRRPTWAVWMLALLFAFNVATMSLKGAKSFRLWLPLLPMIAPICGLGWAVLAGPKGGRAGAHRAALAGLVLLASLAMGVRALRALNTRRFGVYWEAMVLVEREVARDRTAALGAGVEPARPRLASAYHWAVYKREPAEIELVKLPHQVSEWNEFDGDQREACLARLAEMDWFLAHRPILEQERSLFDAIDAGFELVDVLWELDTDPTLGPVFVLRRRTGAPGARLLTAVQPPEDPDAYRRRLGLDRELIAPMDFSARSSPDSPLYDMRMTLLGFEYEVLPGSGLGWITYHWTAPGTLQRDFTVIDRLTAPDDRHAWQNNHGLGYGFRPTSEWTPGAILRESYPVLPGSDSFTEHFQPLGGPYRRGDLVPVELWMTVVEFDAEMAYVSSLRPTAHGAPRPLDMSRPEILAGERRKSAEGYVESPDKLVRLGAFLLPVHPLFRWPDDGRPDPP